MRVKFFELRDAATFIPIFAFRARPDGHITDSEAFLLRRSGFGATSECVIVGRLECSGIDRNCTYDPYSWGGRTYLVAHQFIEQHFDELESGSVIDVEFILGERSSPKVSEAFDPLQAIAQA